MSLLTIIQNTCKAVGKTAPSAAYTSSDTLILEMVALANTSGSELARQYDFPELLREATFSATAVVAQGNLIGNSASALVTNSDYERMVPDTLFNRTADEQISGPIPPSEWAALTSAGSTPVGRSFIIKAGQLYIGPNQGPASNSVIAFGR